MKLRIDRMDAGERLRVSNGVRDVDDVETRFAIPRPSIRNVLRITPFTFFPYITLSPYATFVSLPRNNAP